MAINMVGTIKRLPVDDDGVRKGYGFLTGEDEADRFFHITDCHPHGCFDKLQVGDGVDFEHTEADKGPRAINVRKR